MNTAAIVTFCLVGPCLVAEDHLPAIERTQIAATESSSSSNPYFVKSNPKPRSDSGSAATSNSEVFENVVIPVGKNVILQSAMDYSGASTVAVAVLCFACTTKATSLSSKGLTLEARWQAANAGADIATQGASGFAYFDAGGFIFNVYAEQFNLELLNKGTSAIVLDQVTIFRRAQ